MLFLIDGSKSRAYWDKMFDKGFISSMEDEVGNKVGEAEISRRADALIERLMESSGGEKSLYEPPAFGHAP